MSGDRMQEESGVIRGDSKYDTTGCMQCFVPQVWCEQWQAKSEADELHAVYERVIGGRCQHADIVLSGIAVAMAEDEEFGR